MDRIAGPISYAPPPLEDVFSRRLTAFGADMAIVTVLFLLSCIPVFFVGLLTMGLGFVLYTFLFQAVAVLYGAFTLGGPWSATFGMRMTNLEMRTIDGAKPSVMLAGLHVVTFWMSIITLTPLILLVGLLDERKRLLHDMLIGVTVTRAGRASRTAGGASRAERAEIATL